MTENHQRHLLATFQHVDNLLSETERILAGSPSPFREYALDATPDQRRMAHEQIVRTREAMRRILNQLGIPLNDPITGAVWAARSHLGFARIAAVEIDGQHMAAYGSLSPKDEQLFNRISLEVYDLIGTLERYLAQGWNADVLSDTKPPDNFLK